MGADVVVGEDAGALAHHQDLERFVAAAEIETHSRSVGDLVQPA
jgi:hypothetical protein